MSKRALIIERLQQHPGRSQTAAEIARALNLRDGRSVAFQLKWLERQGVVRVTRFAAGSKIMDLSQRTQWMLPTSERAYRLVRDHKAEVRGPLRSTPSV
jgi:SOS-response transcriptional repressor LexA